MRKPLLLLGALALAYLVRSARIVAQYRRELT
jgi:hypothetical protein